MSIGSKAKTVRRLLEEHNRLTTKIPAKWYFDIISPYAYLHLKQFHRLRPELEIEYVPVLFGGLLRHWETKGPVEVPGKRLHTYRQSLWLAQQLSIPFKMPARHPFIPLSALRLLAYLGPPQAAVEAAFDFVWGQGRDPEHEFSELATILGVSNAQTIVADPAIKQKLIDNTETAITNGVFGVPTFIVNGEIFWGSETIAWLNQYLDNPAMFTSGAMESLSHVEFGVRRRIHPT